MRKFLGRILYCVLIALIFIVVYLFCDPFHILYYKNEYPVNPTINRAYESMLLFKKNNSRYNYDSFILGNSRSRQFHVDEWKKYIGNPNSCFHFDQHSCDLETMTKSIEWIDHNVNDSIKNLLLIMDIDLLDEDININTQSFYNMIPPQLNNNEDFLWFHYLTIKAFYDYHFLHAYVSKYICNQSFKPFMLNAGFHNEFYKDSISNECYWRDRDSLISVNQYYNTIVFPKRDKEIKRSIPFINARQKALLYTIKRIVDKNHCELRIVIGPLYNQVEINPLDLDILKDIFDQSVIFDFSGKNSFTSDYHNYYEQSHYRVSVCDSIMDLIY